MPDINAIDVVPTLTVNMLDKLIKGEDRDKQLIAFARHANGQTEYLDLTFAEPNEDNVVLKFSGYYEGEKSHSKATANKCPCCNGSGSVANPSAGNCESPWQTCPQCGGSGVI